jgi:translocation and assembly module TamB
LSAVTRRRNYQVTLELSGTRERLAASFRSDPPLPELEVLALLAAGEESSQAAGGLVRQVDTGQSVSANSLLLGQATNLVEQRITSLFGLDRFRLDPLASGDSLSSARVTLGKRLTRNVTVTYSVDPSSSENSLIELEWQVSDRMVLVLRQNTDGTYTAEARFERSR